jgi:hypothetical protein
MHGIDAVKQIGRLTRPQGPGERVPKLRQKVITPLAGISQHRPQCWRVAMDIADRCDSDPCHPVSAVSVA